MSSFTVTAEIFEVVFDSDGTPLIHLYGNIPHMDFPVKNLRTKDVYEIETFETAASDQPESEFYGMMFFKLKPRRPFCDIQIGDSIEYYPVNHLGFSEISTDGMKH